MAFLFHNVLNKLKTQQGVYNTLVLSSTIRSSTKALELLFVLKSLFFLLFSIPRTAFGSYCILQHFKIRFINLHKKKNLSSVSGTCA